MKTLDGILYRFRGYVLGALAIALCILPARQIEIACAPDAPTTTAFILCLAGILLRIKTRQFIGEHTRGSIHAADILVKAGPYACTRHPLYISNTLIALSAILFHLGIAPVAIPFALVVILFEFFLAHAENHVFPGVLCRLGDLDVVIVVLFIATRKESFHVLNEGPPLCSKHWISPEWQSVPWPRPPLKFLSWIRIFI